MGGGAAGPRDPRPGPGNRRDRGRRPENLGAEYPRPRPAAPDRLRFPGARQVGPARPPSRSRRTVGFSRENCREPLAAAFYKEKLPPFSEDDLHVISKNLRLLSLVGIREEIFEFPVVIPEDLRKSVLGKLSRLGYAAGQRLLLLNVGAAWETKRWFADRWVNLLGPSSPGAFPLILWGNRLEKTLALAVGERTGTAVAPYLSVREVLALLRLTSLLVSGDTFVLQAACALDVPVVGLFGPTNPRRNGPFAAGDRIVSSEARCGPCYKRTCPTLECLKALSVADVATAVRRYGPGRPRNDQSGA